MYGLAFFSRTIIHFNITKVGIVFIIVLGLLQKAIEKFSGYIHILGFKILPQNESLFPRVLEPYHIP